MDNRSGGRECLNCSVVERNQGVQIRWGHFFDELTRDLFTFRQRIHSKIVSLKYCAVSDYVCKSMQGFNSTIFTYG